MTPTDASLSALATRVGAAAEQLSEQERTVLALREREQADYATIAESAGLELDEVADVLVRARLAVREAVRGAQAPELATEDCAQARRTLSARLDGEDVDAAAAAAAREHAGSCEACRSARRALREASLACRAWQDGLVAEAAAAPLAPPAAPLSEPSPAAPLRPRRVPRPPPAPRRGRRRRGLEALAAGALTATVAALVATTMNGDSPSPAPTGAGPEVISASGATDAERAARRRAARRRARLATPAATASPTSTPAATVAPDQDAVPPPGDRFCPAGDPNCR